MLPQTILQGIKKTSEHGFRDVKSYWISHASLWNSTTVPTLVWFPSQAWQSQYLPLRFDTFWSCCQLCSWDFCIFNGAVACTVYYELQKEVYRPGRHMHTTGQTILILTQPFFFNKLFGNAVEGNEQESSTPFFIMYYFCGNSTKAFWECHKVMNSPTLEKVQGHSLLNIFVEIPKHF